MGEQTQAKNVAIKMGSGGDILRQETHGVKLHAHLQVTCR